MPVPSKLCPAIVLAVSNAVAVAALPVVDPELPDTLPVTLPTKPEAVTVELNVAAPAPDISKVNAVITDPPSLPLKIKSLSCTSVSIVTL